MLHPDVAARIRNKQLKQQAYHKHATRNFQIEDKEWAKDYTSDDSWVEGTISQKPGSVDYDVTVNDKIWHRHADQLRPTAATEMSMAARDESEDQPRKEATTSLPITLNVPASETRSSESTSEASTATTSQAPQKSNEATVASPGPPNTTASRPPKKTKDPPPEPRRNPPRNRKAPDRLNL